MVNGKWLAVLIDFRDLLFEGKKVTVPQGPRIPQPQYTGSRFDKVSLRHTSNNQRAFGVSLPFFAFFVWLSMIVALPQN